jgi:hypothetical protein
MLPRELKAELFNGYPPEARKLVTNYLGALQRLPLSFLPSLLREAIDYDFKFPAERRALERELANLRSLSVQQMADWFAGFAQIRLSPGLERFDWVNAPGQFVEQLSTHLWSSHQLDAFRVAATEYAERLRAAAPPEPPVARRLAIAVVGQGVGAYEQPLFRKLRAHGAYFSNVHPAPYAHWYIDGGEAAKCDAAVTCVSYQKLEPARTALLGKMRAEIDRPGMGPEALRTHLAQLRPVDLGLGNEGDAVLDRFQIRLLTEGSGTQIFSTTFAQWAAREALRRAQPLTLLVRLAPRQRQKPMNELLSASSERAELDPVGSLIDGDMGAYYSWLNLQRLTGAAEASFLAWFEEHGKAVAISPTTPRGTESAAATSMRELLSWVS